MNDKLTVTLGRQVTESMTPDQIYENLLSEYDLSLKEFKVICSKRNEPASPGYSDDHIKFIVLPDTVLILWLKDNILVTAE